jgi:hypothetical protein
MRRWQAHACLPGPSMLRLHLVWARPRPPSVAPSAPAPASAPHPIPPCQVGYGISIVTFLGAVHWGLAMGSAAMASPLLARVSRESYL